MTYPECTALIKQIESKVIGKKSANGFEITELIIIPAGLDEKTRRRWIWSQLGVNPSLPDELRLSSHDYQLMGVCREGEFEPKKILEVFWLTDDFPSLLEH